MVLPIALSKKECKMANNQAAKEIEGFLHSAWRVRAKRCGMIRSRRLAQEVEEVRNSKQ